MIYIAGAMLMYRRMHLAMLEKHATQRLECFRCQRSLQQSADRGHEEIFWCAEHTASYEDSNFYDDRLGVMTVSLLWFVLLPCYVLFQAAVKLISAFRKGSRKVLFPRGAASYGPKARELEFKVKEAQLMGQLNRLTQEHNKVVGTDLAVVDAEVMDEADDPLDTIERAIRRMEDRQFLARLNAGTTTRRRSYP